VGLYIHSPIRLHGVVLNLLSKGTILLFNFTRTFIVSLTWAKVEPRRTMKKPIFNRKRLFIEGVISTVNYLLNLIVPWSVSHVLWHVDPLLGNDCEISSYAIAVAE
jgi:hypothetical protein